MFSGVATRRAPRAAASRISASAWRRFAAASEVDVIWQAAARKEAMVRESCAGVYA